MRQLKLIIKTELYQVLSDKKIITTMLIFMLMLFVFILSNLSIEYERITNPDFTLQAFRDDILNLEYNMLIFIFCILCFAMPILIAADITAGEKERNTLESLFLTNCSRKTILYAKFVTIFLFSLIPFVIGLLFCTLLMFLLPVPIIEIYDIILILLLVLPYSISVSLLLLYNGLKAKTIRSAKSQEQKFLLLIPIICLVLSLITNLESILIYYVAMSGIIWLLYNKSLRYIQTVIMIK